MPQIVTFCGHKWYSTEHGSVVVVTFCGHKWYTTDHKSVVVAVEGGEKVGRHRGMDRY